jgi:hypothetical protein
MRRSRGRAWASGKLFENRNSFPKFLDVVLCIPAFLAEPDYCLNNVCHQIPPRVTFVGHCITKSQFCQNLLLAEMGNYVEPALHEYDDTDNTRIMTRG